VRAGVRAYFNRIDDYQVNQSLANPLATDFVISNAEEVTVWGVEADLVWRPIERLTIRGAVGWQNAEFDAYTFFDPSIGATRDFSGNAVPFVPEFTSSLGVHYDFGNGFYAQTALRGIGKTHFDSSETPLFTENSYALWDAEVGYRANGYSLSLYGRNVLDEEYYSFIDSNIFAGAPGDPQVVGVRATVEF
jgi:iron complex outermembrane receptor protein